MGYVHGYGAPERKFAGPEGSAGPALQLRDGQVIEGYASLFGKRDQGGDVVARGAYAGSLARLKAAGRRVRMLWQHDPMQPIGIWEEVREDATGLWVKGRILTEVEKGREAAALVAAGAMDGLSIGYRTLRADRDAKGGRQLMELELWEVSLVTFPMLPEARVSAKSESGQDTWRRLAQVIDQARLIGPGRSPA